jgi:hypothetical protein
VRVVGSHLGDTLQVGRCRTSNLRPASPSSGELRLRTQWLTRRAC